MTSIGIRELRQNASKYLREVERGGTVTITDRGRPIAQLTPISPVERSLAAQIEKHGLTTPARRSSILDIVTANRPNAVLDEVLTDRDDRIL